MGYTTTFRGSFRLDKKLTPEQAGYLIKFRETRRIKRIASVAESLPDPVRIAAGLPIGTDGAYFTGGVGFFGQDADESCYPAPWGRDTNTHPPEQPGLWCQWVPTADRLGIKWDGGEKFYRHATWLDYIVKHFLRPWGIKAHGEVKWWGESRGHKGITSIVRGRVYDREIGDRQ